MGLRLLLRGCCGAVEHLIGMAGASGHVVEVVGMFGKLGRLPQGAQPPPPIHLDWHPANVS